MKFEIPGQQRVIDMALGGTPPSEIARITGLSINTVNSDLYSARKSGAKIPDFRKGRTRKLGHDVRIPLNALNAIEREARRRGLTANYLAGMILIHVAERNMIKTILPEGERHGG